MIKITFDKGMLVVETDKYNEGVRVENMNFPETIYSIKTISRKSEVMKKMLGLPLFEKSNSCIICGAELGRYKQKICSKACAKIRWQELNRIRLERKRALRENKDNRINVPVRWEK
jgi:predicted nucleic acid-binding Zn ribbon protein